MPSELCDRFISYLAAYGRMVWPKPDIENIAMKVLNLRNVSLMLAIISVFIAVGAELFANVVIAATAFEAPPRSLAIYQGEYGLGRSRFWNVLPPIVMALLILTVVFHWRTPRKRMILTSFLASIVIGLVSALYIFPQYLEIVSAGYSDEVIPELQQRGETWLLIAYVRWAATLLVGILLLLALARPLGHQPASPPK